MERFSLHLRTISSLIASPRDDLAFYSQLDQFPTDKKIGDNAINVIYPLYQYGEYKKYDPEQASYYLPGSSIKGALLQGSNVFGSLMVDDMPIPNAAVDLRNVYKVQYLQNVEKEANFGLFFPNVGVEMVKENTALHGDIYVDKRKNLEELVETASKSTRNKIEQMQSYLSQLIMKCEQEANKCQAVTGILQCANENLCTYAKDSNVILLGGYKGLLHSIVVAKLHEDMKSAIYLDPHTRLPHGLMHVEI